MIIYDDMTLWSVAMRNFPLLPHTINYSSNLPKFCLNPLIISFITYKRNLFPNPSTVQFIAFASFSTSKLYLFITKTVKSSHSIQNISLYPFPKHRPSRPGATAIFVRPVLRSRISNRTSAMDWNSCFSSKSFPANSFQNPTAAKWGSTKSPTSTKRSTLSPQRESSSSPSEPKVRVCTV